MLHQRIANAYQQNRSIGCNALLTTLSSLKLLVTKFKSLHSLFNHLNEIQSKQFRSEFLTIESHRCSQLSPPHATAAVQLLGKLMEIHPSRHSSVRGVCECLCFLVPPHDSSFCSFESAKIKCKRLLLNGLELSLISSVQILVSWKKKKPLYKSIQNWHCSQKP